ncbi:MAG: hypothetical protein OXI86_18120, partial [Candidatus Poribacteria bacterium]|nr:hypothetical protein [Candidatus Poribacteria bacterium]
YARHRFDEFIECRPRSPRVAAAYVYRALVNQEHGDRSRAAEAYDNAISLIGDSHIQAEMVINEIPSLGIQGRNRTDVLQRLDELHKRVDAE